MVAADQNYEALSFDGPITKRPNFSQGRPLARMRIRTRVNLSCMNQWVVLCNALMLLLTFTESWTPSTGAQLREHGVPSLILRTQIPLYASLRSASVKSGDPAQHIHNQSASETLEHDEDKETYQINLQLADWASQCARQRNVTAATLALETLRNMKRPDTVAYNSVIKAVAKVTPARILQVPSTKVAEQLLQDMKDLCESQVEANRAWYDRLSDGTLSDIEISQGPPRVRIKPNVRSYSTVMDALARKGNLEAARRAEKILEDLESAFLVTGDLALEPNLISYNTLLSAYAKCGGEVAVSECLDILASIPMQPDVISYNNVLHAIARSGNADAGEQVQAMLDKMQTRGISPNARSYTTSMDAWSQSGRVDRAYALLEEVLIRFEKTQDMSLKPNAISFSTLIHAYAVSKEEDKALKAYKVFLKMKENDVLPNRYTFNNLLNACATSRSTPRVLELVKKLYHKVLRDYGPDHFTFGTVLKACANILVKDRSFAPTVFREACKRGQVSSGVLWQLRQAVPVETYRELLGGQDGHDIPWNDLPPEWKRNVRDGRNRKISK
jgi:tetratricopeptide (TPR) repeat protein